MTEKRLLVSQELQRSFIDHRLRDAEQLRAIRSADFRRRFGQAADAHVTLRGRAGQRAALWVYPEVRLQRVILKRAREVDPNGQITAYDETAVVFPMPALAHVIGTRTER